MSLIPPLTDCLSSLWPLKRLSNVSSPACGAFTFDSCKPFTAFKLNVLMLVCLDLLACSKKIYSFGATAKEPSWEATLCINNNTHSLLTTNSHLFFMPKHYIFSLYLVVQSLYGEKSNEAHNIKLLLCKFVLAWKKVPKILLFVCFFVFLMNVYFKDQAFVARVTEVLVVNHSRNIKVTLTRCADKLSTEK